MARYRNRSVFGDRQSSGVGKRAFQLLIGIIILAVIGLVVYLGLGDYRPEPQRIERVIEVETTPQ
ncbi:MAG: hypothetical protein AAGG65_19730 [Pseudomonadota bacterium]